MARPASTAASAAWNAQLTASCEELSVALYSWARLRLRAHGSAALLPEDVVQETWLRAWSSPRPGDSSTDSQLRGWVFGIAQNVLFEATRSQSVRRAVVAGGDGGATGFLARFEDTVTSVCTRLSRDETVERFFDLAEGLDDLDRGLLVRCGFEGLSATDAARRLDLTPAAGIKRWQRLRERLRRIDVVRRLGLLTD